MPFRGGVPQPLAPYPFRGSTQSQLGQGVPQSWLGQGVPQSWLGRGYPCPGVPSNWDWGTHLPGQDWGTHPLPSQDRTRVLPLPRLRRGWYALAVSRRRTFLYLQNVQPVSMLIHCGQLISQQYATFQLPM